MCDNKEENKKSKRTIHEFSKTNPNDPGGPYSSKIKSIKKKDEK
jgi:hypothetical protein